MAPSGEVTAELLAATVRGARSLHVRGWYAAECESAALEQLARRPPHDALLAFRQGRLAALDELRRLSGWRRDAHATLVPLTDHDPGRPEPGYDAVETRMMIASLPLGRLTVRERQAFTAVAAGMNGVEAAALLGLSPSRITLLMRQARRKLAWKAAA